MYARLLQPLVHVLHRVESPAPDILASLLVLHGLLLPDDKAPHDEYDIDLFANVALSQGLLVVLTALLDLPRLRVVGPCTDWDATVGDELLVLITHLAQLGNIRQASTLAKLDAYIKEEEDTSDAAAQAIARVKTISTRWTALVAAQHDFARFGYVGHSALLVAVELRHHAVATLFMEDVGVPAATADPHGTSSLMKALATGHSGIVDDVLRGGADVNAINNRDQTVLKFCLVSTARLQSLEAAMATLRLPPSAATFDAAIALDHVVVDTSPGHLEACLARGADPNISDGDGAFPLHWVLSSAHIRTGMRGCTVCLRFESTALPPDAIVALTTMLLEHDAHVDACNKLGQTPLHVAVLNGHGRAALTLLAHGAHPFRTDRFGCLPLHYLCAGACGAETLAVLDAMLALASKFEVVPGTYADLRKGKSPAEKMLVELDAILDNGLHLLVAPRALTTRPLSRDALLTFPTKSNLSPVFYACGAWEPELDVVNACNKGTAATRLAVIRHLVQHYGLDIATTTTTDQHVNALHVAAKYDRAGSNGPILGYLVDHHAELVNAVHDPRAIDTFGVLAPESVVRYAPQDDDDGGGVAAYVSSYCHFHEYHIVTATGDHRNHVPRHALSLDEDASLLLVGDTSTSNSHDNNHEARHFEFAFAPIHYAVQHSDNATWQLLHAGASLLPEGSDVPVLALACAAQRSVDIVEYLAPRLAPQANVRVELSPTMTGTALHFAVAAGNLEMTRVLLSSGHATMKVKRSSDGCTPLQVACAVGSAKMVLLLAAHGAFATNNVETAHSPLLLVRSNETIDALVRANFVTKSQLRVLAQIVLTEDNNYSSDVVVPDWLGSYAPPACDATTRPNQNEANGTDTTAKRRDEDDCSSMAMDAKSTHVEGFGTPIEPEITIS
ncbi:Aste57867_21717 [Aphanomyces stellatus]|uniref:Aste57867_21717 protein n=1 Tax=Aphanomyces stellatus TaxID=120398 RepID=A0A485LI97_9STRA|nr:hypothetical protein As57867_021648 [Aphanomyces stellatus]VFT98386.1 Aste57867_21717 [Aphanomyces stellatus]